MGTSRPSGTPAMRRDSGDPYVPNVKKDNVTEEEMMALNKKISYKDGGFGATVKWWREIPFALLCIIIFFVLSYHWRDQITIFVNMSLATLFIVILILMSRFFGLGELLGGMIRVLPFVKRSE